MRRCILSRSAGPGPLPPSAGRISKLERYISLLQSSLLAGNDRPAIQSTSASMQAVGNKKWRNGLADAEGGDCNITDEQFEPLVGHIDTYRSPGPEALSLIPLWWMALVAFFPDFSMMERLWLTMLFQRGTIVQSKKERQSSMVVFASRAGVVLWRMKRVDIDGAQACFWELDF